MYWRLREIERVRLSAQADEAVAAG
jgi:hypothetical protein